MCILFMRNKFQSLSCFSYEETCNYGKCRDIFAKDLNVIGEKCNNFLVVTLLTSLKIGCSPNKLYLKIMNNILKCVNTYR